MKLSINNSIVNGKYISILIVFSLVQESAENDKQKIVEHLQIVFRTPSTTSDDDFPDEFSIRVNQFNTSVDVEFFRIDEDHDRYPILEDHIYTNSHEAQRVHLSGQRVNSFS